MKKYLLVFLIMTIFTSCRDLNTRIEKYPKHSEFYGNSFFSVDSTLPNNVYKTYSMQFENGSNDLSKFSFYVKDKKFFAKLIHPE